MSIRKTLCRVGVGLLVAAAVAVTACNGGDKGVTPPEKKPWGGADIAPAKGTATAVDPTVTIDGLTWTQKNLDIETPDSWCYDDDPANCEIYGRLYTWEAAKSACESLGDSWRLPDTADWNKLVNYAGGPSNAGTRLKSTSGWNDNGNGTDNYGFSALPGGYRYTSGCSFCDVLLFYGVGNSCYWWSATENGSSHAYDYYSNNEGYVIMELAIVGVYESTDDKSSGFSVRCVKDDGSTTSIREVERRIY